MLLLLLSLLLSVQLIPDSVVAVAVVVLVVAAIAAIAAFVVLD